MLDIPTIHLVICDHEAESSLWGVLSLCAGWGCPSFASGFTQHSGGCSHCVQAGVALALRLLSWMHSVGSHDSGPFGVVIHGHT